MPVRTLNIGSMWHVLIFGAYIGGSLRAIEPQDFLDQLGHLRVLVHRATFETKKARNKPTNIDVRPIIYEVWADAEHSAAYIDTNTGEQSKGAGGDAGLQYHRVSDLLPPST